MNTLCSPVTSRITYIAVLAACGLSILQTSYAQSSKATLEEIVVTAQKREENIMDVPLSIATLSGQKLESKFASGETILAISGTVPGLYAETSNGRAGPRFYMRGLGNANFTTTASQPVSYVVDDVVRESPLMKNFPVFDVARIEVIRGPQGTLFGRNTTAGIIKVDSRRPTEETQGYLNLSVGERDTVNAEAAVGGTLIDGKLLGRLALLSQNRGNWIENAYTGNKHATGGFNELAGRAQLLWTPTDRFSALLLYQRRELDGNSGNIFRANVLTAGSNDLNSNFHWDRVAFDNIDPVLGLNPQILEGEGASLKLEWDVGNHVITSITSYNQQTQRTRADVDGGVVDPTFASDVPDGFTFDTPSFTIPALGPALTFPGNIFISVIGGGARHEAKQLTEEFRISSESDGRFNYQVGAFFFDDELIEQDLDADLMPSQISRHENSAWGIFGQGDLYINPELTLTVGLRYSSDEKDVTPVFADFAFTHVEDDNLSGNVTLTKRLGDDALVYGRIATGFRAPSVSTRSVLFGGSLTTATSETIGSIEVGYKAKLLDNRIRLNSAVYYYEIDDIQLTAIGGEANFTDLLNANQGTGYGAEFDIEFAASENLLLSAGFSYNPTEIEDDTLAVAVCRQCTITDPLNQNGRALVDGNPFQHAPKWLLNAELSYVQPLSGDDEIFFYTDWKMKGETNDFLYESIEYEYDNQFEGGVRVGYRRGAAHQIEIAIFGRNITNEANIIGGVDFSNNTAFVNEPRTWGAGFVYRF